MSTAPMLEDRADQAYVGIRTQAAMRDLPTLIPQLHREVYDWLEQRGLSPAGAPFIRYHVINMETKLDIELGVPVATAVGGDDRVKGGVLPAGRYAALTYTGDYAGLMAANAQLLDWGATQGLAWDQWETAEGDAFGARFETYITDPGNEPDPAKWQTEVAIRLADGRSP
jgi:effector-binding domain-containing protein